MNSIAILAIVLILVLVILAGNTMIAVAFLRGRKDHFKTLGGRDDAALDELHRRVQEISRKKD
ncbi:MAG TPA: hypothetical protein VLX61_14830 [Anaerolineales bacterium]|nr:hypothetical protein [Anaerolineales bacterium]